MRPNSPLMFFSASLLPVGLMLQAVTPPTLQSAKPPFVLRLDYMSQRDSPVQTCAVVFDDRTVHFERLGPSQLGGSTEHPAILMSGKVYVRALSDAEWTALVGIVERLRPLAKPSPAIWRGSLTSRDGRMIDVTIASTEPHAGVRFADPDGKLAAPEPIGELITWLLQMRNVKSSPLKGAKPDGCDER